MVWCSDKQKVICGHIARSVVTMVVPALSLAMAHSAADVDANSLAFGGRVSMWFFIGIFSLLFLASLGAMVYLWLQKERRVWAGVAASLVLISAVVLGFGVSSLFRAPSIVPNISLRAQQWYAGYGDGISQAEPIKVEVGSVVELQVFTEDAPYTLLIPELGLNSSFKQGESASVQFLASDLGTYRSKNKPQVNIQVLSTNDYRAFLANRKKP